MMKRYLLSIILGILTFCNQANGQIDLNFGGGSGNVGSTVDIDVTISGFTNMGGLQFTAEWDSLVMTFNSIVSVNSTLPVFDEENFGTPDDLGVEEGQFTMSWSDFTGNSSLADGELLFTVRLNLVGNECDISEISLSETADLGIESFDGNLNELTVTFTSEEIMINGADCNGTGGGDELTVTASMETVGVGGMVCVPLTVTNFNDVQSGSGTIIWDPTVISYKGLENLALAGVDGSLNTSNVDNGELKFVWSNPDPANPLSLADGTAIFDICFNAVGNVGDMSPVTLSEVGSLGFEFADDDGTAFPQILTDGKVTIVEDQEDPFTLIVSDVTVSLSEGTGCVDISVENFNNILSTQYVLTWNTTILGNAMPGNFNLAGVNANSFLVNNNDGSATFSWNDNMGVNLPDGTVIYTLCFDLLQCDVTSPVQIVSQGSTNIEIVDGDTNEITNLSIDQGSITIECVNNDPCDDFSIANVDNTCAGSLNGNVTINVASGCTYSWTNSAGAEIATTQNLLGVGVGVYTLTASCDGSVTCTLMAEVNAIPAPTVTGTVTNAACGDLGAIDVNVTGGSGNYNYNWNPSQPNSPNIANLTVGTYNLTVTDNDSECTATSSFEVTNVQQDLVITGSQISDETCIENDGSITLNVSGGCMPYTYAWSDNSIGNTPNATNLSAGVYAVTVSDDASPANTVTGSYTVDGFTAIELDGLPTILPENQGMGDGAITIEVMGGTSPYTYNWSGPTPNLPNSNMITGLSAGNYTVAVSDASGCDVILGPFLIINIEDPTEEPELGVVEAVDIINGFSVVCNGDATGSISGSLVNGAGPFTITLSGDATATLNQDNLGTFEFENLSAGTYTVTVENSAGTDSAGPIEITEPDEIAYTIDSGCDEEEQCDGFIDLDVSGGFGDITYTWSDPDLEGNSVDDLCQGTYVVTFQDENGCERMESITIDPCSMVPTGCYEVRNVITPNGDGMNETFSVTCINDFPSTLEVYDRYGKLVFDQEVYDGTWNGLSNSGEELIEGGYMYIIVIDFGQGNREVMKGTITLFRD